MTTDELDPPSPKAPQAEPGGPMLLPIAAGPCQGTCPDCPHRQTPPPDAPKT